MNHQAFHVKQNSRLVPHNSIPSSEISIQNSNSIQTPQYHAEIILSHFSSAYQRSIHTDVEVFCDGHLISKAHRIVLAAFSTTLESVLRLHDFRNPVINLEIDSKITGVSANDLTAIINFFYSGKIRLSEDSIFNSFRSLGCPTVLSLLPQLEQGVNVELTMDYSSHSAFFESALERFSAEAAFYDCVLTFKNCSINCHRLVICAFSEILEEVLKLVTNCECVILDVNSIVGFRENGISRYVEESKIITAFIGFNPI
ncbi:BTB/POZ domain-containing protein [Ditylenchus destructor]|uniref:BTB/POZ domain-containing protein n=1 Tax=Ditylenchus destructor TaxID=166010 RepID=A0AAD4R364_9BILA|nr:BTB/POZ domain-containing protein [Ditylenchus destructor]